MAKKTLENLRSGYEQLFASMQVLPAKRALVQGLVDKIVANRSVYESIMLETGVPWQVVGVIHCMEAGLRMNGHLHNGDPLSARTTHVPKGRPKTGEPPFTFAESAADALRMKKYDGLQEWGVAETLFRLEAFNGFGYYSKGIHSPYLWSFSNHYSKGKYVADGKYDPAAVSKQCGAAVLLGLMVEIGIFTFNALPKPLSVSVGGMATGVPAFIQKGNSWIAPRKLIPHVPGLAILAVHPSPFEITLRYAPSPSVDRMRTLPARMHDGAGFVDAGDFVRSFLEWDLSLSGGRLELTKP